MKKDIFDNNSNPFTVPDGYFDSLQERIMNRIRTEENHTKSERRIIRMISFRKLVAAAACILFILTGAAIYVSHSSKQSSIAETVIDDDFFRWLYASDAATWLSESLDVIMPENFTGFEMDFSEEDEAIINFLERDNISIAAILYSFENFP